MRRKRNRGGSQQASEAGQAALIGFLNHSLQASHQFSVGFELLNEITVHPVLRVVHVLVNTPSPRLLHLHLKIFAVPGRGGSVRSGAVYNGL